MGEINKSTEFLEVQLFKIFKDEHLEDDTEV
jgi:hypothetical protein